MKGAETFKALAEGKTVYFPQVRASYKLDANGTMWVKYKGNFKSYDWIVETSASTRLWEDECEIVDGYDLDVHQAIEEMKKGHKTICEVQPYDIYRIVDGDLIDKFGTVDFFTIEQVQSKWRVVE